MLKEDSVSSLHRNIHSSKGGCNSNTAVRRPQKQLTCNCNKKARKTHAQLKRIFLRFCLFYRKQTNFTTENEKRLSIPSPRESVHSQLWSIFTYIHSSSSSVAKLYSNIRICHDQRAPTCMQEALFKNRDWWTRSYRLIARPISMFQSNSVLYACTQPFKDNVLQSIPTFKAWQGAGMAQSPLTGPG